MWGKVTFTGKDHTGIRTSFSKMIKKSPTSGKTTRCTGAFTYKNMSYLSTPYCDYSPESIITVDNGYC
jgi:hypothetical protein